MKFTKKIFSNGLTLLHEKRDVPVTTVSIASRFGAAYEDEKEKGISHVIEHLCFKGTQKRTTEQISSEIEKIGGILNAFTHEEITLYYAKLPSKNMNIAMDVLFDIYFNSAFPENEISKEIDVISEEIKMRKDNPHIYVCDKIKQNLYEKPFGLSISGDEKSIKSLSREDIVLKHKQKYCPSNTIVCIIGNNSIDEVERFIESFQFPENNLSEKIKTPTEVILNNSEKREGLEQANIAIGIHFPTFSSEDRYSAQLFNSIFGEGMSSKLFIEIREKLGLVYAIKSDYVYGKDYGYLMIYAGTKKENVNQVIEIIKNEFIKMKNISEKELEDAKKQLIGNHLVSSESSDETVVNIALEEIMGNAEHYFKFEENINKVNIVDIQKLVSYSSFASFVLE